jgi:hypothetical protein
LDFTIACPTCAVASDIADVPMRLMPPEGWHDESPTAALALRVAAAVRSTAEDRVVSPRPWMTAWIRRTWSAPGARSSASSKRVIPNGTGRSRSRIFPTGLKLDFGELHADQAH